MNGQKESLIKDLLNASLKEMMSVVKADCGSLFLFDPEHKELVLDAFYNSCSLSLEGLRQKIGEGISGKVAGIKKAVLVKDIEKDQRFIRNGFRHYRTNSFICIPVATSQEILGLINLADKSTGEPFSEKDLELANTIARHACLCVGMLRDCVSNNLSLERYASVGKLAAGVVHERNNPLDGVIRYTNILLNQIENNSIAQEYLLEAKKGLNRIANITKSLLEFSRQINVSPAKVDKFFEINRLVDESLEFLCDRLNDGIRVHKRFANNLPKIMDLGISHIVVNMIRNAFDAMPAGGVLEISAHKNDGGLEVIFKDTGIGISAENISQIFDPFFSTKSIEKGTGLGLAICKEIINKYEGKIEVASLPGEGSTFKVSIPKKYLKNA